MYDIMQIVHYFLYRSSMTPKKLQKLLYYAYAWTLALLNESIDDIHFKLFNEPIQAWVHGPVIPSIYFKYKKYGGSDIPLEIDCNDEVFSSDVLDILNQVWNVYGGYTGNDLEEITHMEKPWLEARKNIPIYESSTEVLSDKIIFEYYNEQAIA